MMLFLQEDGCFALQLLFVQNEDRKLYSSASVMLWSLFVPLIVAGSLQDGGNSAMQVDLPDDRPDLQEVPGEDGDSASEDLAMLRQEEWARAEETYGLYRPDPNEEVVYVHRQTTARFAVAPVTWDPIPVGHNVLPDEILDDIARWYNDIHDRWEDITWWLCRVHSSSRSSRQPMEAISKRNQTWLAQHPVQRDPAMFNATEVENGPAAQKMTYKIQKWNVLSRRVHPILVANARS